MHYNRKLFFYVVFLSVNFLFAQKIVSEEKNYVLKIQTKNKFERTQVTELGLIPEEIFEKYVRVIASAQELNKIKSHLKLPFQVESEIKIENIGIRDFPTQDDAYHDYREMVLFLENLSQQFPTRTRLHEIGQSLEGRKILALHISTEFDASQSQAKPGIVFMGGHHAREHLSIEVPLNLAHFVLYESEKNQKLMDVLKERDLWIIPMVNPDGCEYDISPAYRWWRKNRRNNEDGSFGVDLNRNYGYEWGGRGASDNTSSQIYHGASAFSEPETQTIRDFVDQHHNLKALVSYHTFSELILYPWGYTYDSVSNPLDLKAYENMAFEMSRITGYTPQQSSDLYLTSGDTTDWAYGQHGIFSFTLELSPKSLDDGGFYPGNIIDRVVQTNLQTAIFMIEMAGHPYTPPL
ncbi:MAG: zinc carboxypeptidase [Deltaproteobacteria bacterium]|nr:zinc carboxypeptidase [Deltaproteobacteria bacterium]